MTLDTMSDFDIDEFNNPYVPSPISSYPSSPVNKLPDDNIMMDVSPESPRCRFTAREKGKGKDIALPSTLLPPPIPLAAPGADEAVDVSTTSGSASVLIPEDSGFSTLSIQYGSSEILTSSSLNLINCVFFVPLRILICVVCGIAVQPRSIRRHRQGEPHLDSPAISQAEVDTMITLYDIFLGDALVNPAYPLPVVPGIPFTRGWSCSFSDCTHGRKSRKKMANHTQSAHGIGIKQLEPRQCNVQSIFESNATYYVVDTPSVSLLAPTQPDPLDSLFSTYQNITSKIVSTVSNDSAHLSPFLAKYKWHEIVGDTLPLDIKDWISTPRDDEHELLGLTRGVQLYYSNIKQTMDDGDAWTTVLRWVNTPKQ
jgi:hypothetical protein